MAAAFLHWEASVRLTSIIKALVTAGLALAVTTSAASAEVGTATHHYRLVDLGTLGGESSFATAMNDRGVVVGSSTVADGSFHGFRWRNGSMTDLGLFRPTDINNRGQIVGTFDDQGNAFLWTAGRLTDLGSLGGPFTSPTAINDRGQVVGVSATTDGPAVPFLWSKGHMRRLPLDSVSDINNRGQVTGGRLQSGGGFHASVWFRGRVTDLGAAAFDRSNTYGINNRGWVIGWVFSAEQTERGTLWRKATRTDTGTLGGQRTQLKAINDRGQILAVSQVADGNDHPALWWRGVLTDLTTLGLGADIDLVDLNNRGEIAASIRPVFGISHAVIYR